MSSTLFHISAGHTSPNDEQIIARTHISEQTYSKSYHLLSHRISEINFLFSIFIFSSVSVTLAQYHSTCHQMDHCRIPAFQMVDVAPIMVFQNANGASAHSGDWPNNLSRLWCRAAKLSIRLINAWKWPKQSYVHYKRHAVNWLFAQLHHSPTIWEPVHAMNWPQWAKMQSPQIQQQQISSISSR